MQNKHLFLLYIFNDIYKKRRICILVFLCYNKFGDKMVALITGASSGIGRDIAVELSRRGYDLILVARNRKKLNALSKEIFTHATIISMDLSKPENCYKLYEKVKQDNISILINNAGFGLCGNFDKLSLESELNMIDLNIKAVHILTKLFYKDFINKNNAYILNVASSAAFLPGPLMNTYYATKSYVLHLSEALYEENRRAKKHVTISILCPGPVDTNFNKVANVSFSIKPLSSTFVAQYAVKKMFQKKLIIIPSFKMKCTYYIQKIIPIKILMRITYQIQRKKFNV